MPFSTPLSCLLVVLLVVPLHSCAPEESQKKVAESSAGSPGFLWRASAITASVEEDHQFTLMGQYLLLEQKLEVGETGWTGMKLDLPENWSVQNLGVEGDKVVLRIAGGRAFRLGPANTGKLSFAILDGGDKTDEALERLWTEHAAGSSEWRAVLRGSGWGEREFTECYADAAREILSATTEIPESMTVSVSISGDVHTCYLDNAWTEARREDADSVAVIENYIDSLAQTHLERNSALDPATLTIVVRDQTYVEFMRQNAGTTSIPARELVSDLYEVVAINTPAKMTVCDVSELRSAGLNVDQAFDRARQNLAETARTLEVHGDKPVQMVVVGDYLESGVLVLAEVWGRLNATVAGDLVAAVPTRDLVVFTGTEEEGGVEALRQAVKRAMDGGDHPVSASLIVWRGGRWNGY